MEGVHRPPVREPEEPLRVKEGGLAEGDAGIVHVAIRDGLLNQPGAAGDAHLRAQDEQAGPAQPLDAPPVNAVALHEAVAVAPPTQAGAADNAVHHAAHPPHPFRGVVAVIAADTLDDLPQLARGHRVGMQRPVIAVGRLPGPLRVRRGLVFHLVHVLPALVPGGGHLLVFGAPQRTPDAKRVIGEPALRVGDVLGDVAVPRDRVFRHRFPKRPRKRARYGRKQADPQPGDLVGGQRERKCFHHAPQPALLGVKAHQVGVGVDHAAADVDGLVERLIQIRGLSQVVQRIADADGLDLVVEPARPDDEGQALR